MVVLFLSANEGFTQHLHYRMFDEKDGLPGTKILDIEQDNEGFMWFLCQNQVLRFDGDVFNSFSIEKPGVSVMNKDYFGRIWFRSRRKYLRYFENGRIHDYEYNHILGSYKGAGIKSIYVAKDKSLWVGLVSEAKFETPCFLHIDSAGNIQEIQRPNKRSNWIIKELEDTFLQAVKYEGKYTLDSLNMYVEGPDGHNEYVVPNYLERHVYRIQGHYVMASRYQGICAVDDKKRTYPKLTGLRFLDIDASQKGEVFIPREIGGVFYFERPDFNEEPQVFFETEHISSLYQSQSQGCWFGAITGEVYYVPSLEARVFDAEMGLPYGRIVNTFRETDKLWLVYKEGIVSTLSLGQMTVENYDFKTLIQNLHLFPEHKKIMLSTPYPLKVPSNFNYSVSFKGSINNGAPFSKTDLYFGGGRAIHEWSLSKDSLLKTHRLKEKTIDQYRIEANHYLFSDTKGLHSIKDGEITSFAESIEVLGHAVNQIVPLGNHWFALNCGINGLLMLKYNHSIQICYPLYSINKGAIQNVALGPEGYLWVASSIGVDQFDFSTQEDTVHMETLQHIGFKEGFPRKKLNDLLIDSKHIWLASTEEVIRLPTKGEPKVVKPLQASITQIVHGEEVIHSAKVGSLLYSTQPTTFQFSSPDFNYPQGLEYHSRLLGADTAWTNTGAKSRQFHALPPGAYEFQVVVRNKHGDISPPTSVPFAIAPRYWQTAGFKVAAFVVGLLILGLFGYLRMQRIKQRKHLIAEIKSYKNKTLRLQMNPHFMYNTLGSIQSFVLQEESRLSSKYIAKFSRLMRIIFEHNTKELITLSEELEALKLYVELESLRRKDHLDFELDIAASVDVHKTLIPPMLLQPLVENSIQHGLTGRAKNLISVRIKAKDEGLKFEVRDNGSWNNASKTKEKRVSGGAITADRIALFNQQRHHKGAMDMEQLEGVGTQVTFSIAHITTN